MRLSSVPKGEFEVIKDGEFQSTGSLYDSRDQRLVLIASSEKLPSNAFDGRISCVVTTKELVNSLPKTIGIIASNDPTETFYNLHNNLCQKPEFRLQDFENEISLKAEIHSTAVIAGKSVRIGNDCKIGPNAVVLEHSTLEDGVVIGPGTVVGSMPSMTYLHKGVPTHILSAGGVILRKKVGIHASCDVSRSIFTGHTELGEHSHFDNLVSVGSNVRIGKRTYLIASATVAANVWIGDDVWIGPNCVISEGVRVGDKALVSLGAVVVDDVEPGKRVSGNFAVDHVRFLEFIKKIR